jgi:hypothetical protein
MRIAIITQPLISNYGGLLQNWALQTVLRREFPGVDVVTFDQVDSVAPLYLRIGSAVKHIFWSNKDKNNVCSQFDSFRDKNIAATYKARTFSDFKKLDRIYAPDVYIVGSDQVWRPSMVFNLDANFLAFTQCHCKIAYAASFGIDTWEFTPSQTLRCRNLIKDFTAVSVREKDGIGLCSDYLGREACLVLDPTLLLLEEDYARLIQGNPVDGEDYVFTYILDSDSEKRVFVNSLIGNLPERNAAHNMLGDMPQVRPSVEEWLSAIRNASMVICDSFHGAAFSIIFNKDFYVLGNQQRGNSRLNSLLSLFGLSDRLVESEQAAKRLSPIDWQQVNCCHRRLINKSLSFLQSALCT